MTEHEQYSAIVVTFRRPDSLREVLNSVVAQQPPPSLVVVADNDPAQSAESVVDEFASDEFTTAAHTFIRYVPVGENLGPAGGWAAAASDAQHDLRRGEWLLVIDDDDALQHNGVVQRILGSDPSHAADCAAIGLRGACFDRTTARLHRVEPAEGQAAPADYLASGGAALYRWVAVDEVGFFNQRLFFGFEDLDLGFRLRKAGWSLWTAPQPSIHNVPDTASNVVAWREYYKTRALLWILQEHTNAWAIVVTLIRSVVLGSLRLAVLRRRPDAAWARAVGAVDGLSGRLGRRRYSPETNAPKPQGIERV